MAVLRTRSRTFAPAPSSPPQWRRRLVFGLEPFPANQARSQQSTGAILLCRLNGNRHLAQVHCDDDQPNQNNHEQPSRHYDSAMLLSGLGLRQWSNGRRSGKHSARRIATLVCAVKRLSWRLDSEWWEDVSGSISTRTIAEPSAPPWHPFPENASVDFEAAGRRGYSSGKQDLILSSQR